MVGAEGADPSSLASKASTLAAMLRPDRWTTARESNPARNGLQPSPTPGGYRGLRRLNQPQATLLPCIRPRCRTPQSAAWLAAQASGFNISLNPCETTMEVNSRT